MALSIVAISDTHSKHDSVVIPPCDILIHAGDESFLGTKDEIENFAEWFDKQPAKHLVWTPGNHSVEFAQQFPNSVQWVKDKSPRTNILINESVTLEGVKIWGSPITPLFRNWAYNVSRGEAIRRYWEMIPDDVDIVVVHGPPYGILDNVSTYALVPEHVGCEELAARLQLIQPKLCIFGHIHECHGIEYHHKTMFVNAAIMSPKYGKLNNPTVINYGDL